MSTLLTIPQSTQAGEVFIKLLEVNPDLAREMLIAAGNTEADADKVIAGVKEQITVSARREELATFTTFLTEGFIIAADDFTSEIPDDIDQIEVKVGYTSEETKIGGDQTIPAETWYVSNVKVKFADADKWVVLSKIGKHKPSSGNGNSKSVPVPPELKDQGYNSWVSYGRVTYPDVDFTNQSACVVLAKQGNMVYLKAKAAHQEAKGD